MIRMCQSFAQPATIRNGQEQCVPWNRPTIASFDAVVIATAHACINYQNLSDCALCIVDTRNVMATFHVPPGRVWKA